MLVQKGVSMAVDCPICKLNPKDVENISDSEAQTLIASLQERQGWCFDHIFAFADLVKRFPFEARSWLRAMVTGAKNLEA
jgi:hypothetical protein